MYKPGDTILCWAAGDQYIAHKEMVYLGKDKIGEKILVAHKEKGWDIILLEALPKNSYRKVGSSNLLKLGNKGRVIIYQYWISQDKFDLTVKLKYGLWKLDDPESMPSWVESIS